MADGIIFPIYQMKTIFIIVHEIQKPGDIPFRKKHSVYIDITGGQSNSLLKNRGENMQQQKWTFESQK